MTPDAGAVAVGVAAAGRTSATLLEMRGITKDWRNEEPPVLDGVDLVVPRGASVFVGGENGAGKTTLLRIACGLITPEAGHIEMAGLQPQRDRRAYQAAIGFLSAGNSGLYGRLTVHQHLDYWSRLAFLSGEIRLTAIARTQETFELDALHDRRVDRLSMGQRQRLRLAVTFLHGPKLVLLDEPVTSLDAKGTALLRAAVERITAAGGAAVVCAPDREYIAGMQFEPALTLEHGKLRPI